VQKSVVSLLSLFSLALVACGGSAIETGIDQARAGSPGAGAPSAGAPSAGASDGGTPGGGTPGAGAANGGAAGIGNAGAGGCGVTACPAIIGYCAGGYHLGTAVGQCCPGCIPNSTTDCAQGAVNYQDFEQTQIMFHNFCMTDTDCVLAPENNACASTCGIAISVSAEASVVSALTDDANNNCGTCPPSSTPECPGVYASCTYGACVLNTPVHN
jgi:hypothetical protein